MAAEHTLQDYFVFSDDKRAALVLDALEQRFCTQPIFVAGGHDGDRETCRRVGQREVIDFIHKQIYLANHSPKEGQ